MSSPEYQTLLADSSFRLERITFAKRRNGNLEEIVGKQCRDESLVGKIKNTCPVSPSGQEEGEGITENYAIAAKWCKKAAEHVLDLGGAGQGRNHLALLYMEGPSSERSRSGLYVVPAR